MRPDHDEWGLRGAEWAAQRATCLRRSVGCVLVNGRNQVLSTGYNGKAAGLPHCNDPERVDGIVPVVVHGEGANAVYDNTASYKHACAGAWLKSGQGLDLCEAIHAEQNALLQCGDVYAIRTCYVTHSPCITCVKLLMNTGCKRIVFREKYAHDEAAKKLWLGNNKASMPVGMQRGWLHLPCGS